MTAPLFDTGRREIAPGAVHLPGWLDLGQQREILAAAREWALGPVPMRAPTLPSGHRMSVRMVCLGWHWRPYQYTRTADDAGGARVAELPGWLADLGRAALVAAYQQPTAGEHYSPDTALVNFYDADAKMGMHQDRDEQASDPVVSLSIGDTCLFRFGNTSTRSKPYTDLELRSGDAFVFGGPSRHAYHGVPAIRPGTADPGLGMDGGRVNITLRVTGMA